MSPLDLLLAQPPGVQAVLLIGGLVVLVCVIGLAMDDAVRRGRQKRSVSLGAKALEQIKR